MAHNPALKTLNGEAWIAIQTAYLPNDKIFVRQKKYVFIVIESEATLFRVHVFATT